MKKATRKYATINTTEAGIEVMALLTSLIGDFYYSLITVEMRKKDEQQPMVETKHSISNLRS